MKKAIIITSLAAVLSTNSQADTLLGLYIGGQIWANQADGSFGEGELAEDQTSFSFKDKTQSNYFIALEHPIPLIPNLKIASTTLDTKGNTDLQSQFTFGGQTYDVNAHVDAVFDLSYIDYTFYYELFDNDLLTIDFGLTARDIDTHISASSIYSSDTEEGGQNTITSELGGSGIVPMLYVSTIVGLPFTGFNVFAEGNFASYDDQTLYDYQVGVSYEVLDNLAVDLNVMLGYRSMKLELNDLDDLYSDLTFDGVFVGTIVHF
ncbi:TIGR04219 family outer membrane beta-barrel protein [Colwellia sp. MSW7]|uniref:TIGR04219 family outer membrane beta-barrel protein n=1 Tax=Colwellia maritima TaxID=2912588 RepID=A0ABS9X3S3_9GAMM|nr:TIGR04219 family outer membrane beta-barrel protein [Colwellia maritima]MCI2284829.1 TIGR04219 family outer membrane beta-barrel protein [Colwellia maritima]